MRADMFKVIVERPRRGGWVSDGARAFRNSEDVPAKIGMRQGYRARKWLNENLAPLRRFFESRVGQPWDTVYSEVCKTIDGRSTVKQHILQHIEDMVVVDTRLVNGHVVGRSWSSNETLLEDLRQTLYVDPRSGYLMRNTAPLWKRRRQREARARRMKELAATRRILDARRQLHKIGGLWFLVEVAELPPPRTIARTVNGEVKERQHHEKRWDVLRKVLVSYTNGWQSAGGGTASNNELYGQPTFYAVSKRQLSRGEARRLGASS